MSFSHIWDPDLSALGEGTATEFAQPGQGLFGSLFSLLTGDTTAAASPAQTQVLYLQEPGTASPISAGDIYQGGVGDCFLLSAIGELALNHPSDISGMIQSLANGTENVTLYAPTRGSLFSHGSSALSPVSVNVTNSFPSDSADSGTGQDVVGNEKEIWPQVLEKAVANLDGGYSVLNEGGNPATAMAQLTGQQAVAMSPNNLSQSALQAFMAAGDLITMDTASSSALPYNLVGDHAYMFDKLTTSNGTAMVQLLNPWGTDQPALIPLSQLSKGIVEVDVGRA